MAIEPNSSKPSGDVGVRELRQNLSVYLARVMAGEELTVTARGRPVARLTPLVPRQGRMLDALVAQGLATAPLLPGGAGAMKPMASLTGKTLSDTLQEMRDEERY